MGTQSGTGGSDHIGFGRAHVHQQAAWLQMGGNVAQAVCGAADRHRQQDQVRALHRLGRAVHGLMDDATLQRFFTCTFRGAEADHALHQAFVLQGKGKRGAHQAAAHQAELLVDHAPTG